MKKLPPMVLVTWHDARHESEKFQEDFTHKPLTVYTLGFLLRSDKVGVAVAVEANAEDAEVRDVTFIPRGMVVKMRRLR